MNFTRLRLAGFKTFVDATEAPIEPGLTGVVGPNGCGKSNLLEALRWVMGESSFKSLRGSGMEDVIFAGSGGRPARNHAEVILTLDNSARLAPEPFNQAAEIEVSRKISRGLGSTYRINGREARPRDVQEAIYSLLMMQNGFMAESANIEELDPAFADMPILR
ncbi:AAA family ATPase, partial [Hansschlegelia beijingensis]